MNRKAGGGGAGWHLRGEPPLAHNKKDTPSRDGGYRAPASDRVVESAPVEAGAHQSLAGPRMDPIWCWFSSVTFTVGDAR